MSFLDSRSHSAPAGFGKSVRRREDPRLITGRGRFSDDVNLPGQAYAYVVRSPHAHARIQKIDVDGAAQCPGVITVLTGRDAEADGLRPIPHRPVPTNPHEVPLRSRDGSDFFIAPQPVLPTDTVRFAGEAVAFVVGETRAAAEDAAEYVLVDYEPLPAVTEVEQALAPGAPLVWKEHGSNLCVDSEAGDAAATDKAFSQASHVVRLTLRIPRVTGVPMEPRAVVAVYDESTDRYTVYAGSGGVVRQRDEIAGALGVDKQAVRVVAQDVGGNFGTRNHSYPEFVLVAWAARRLRRPVKWTCERRECFLSDYHGRDLTSEAELALDDDGRFLALRAVNTSNVGSHAISFVPLAKGVAMATSVYDVPAASLRARAVLTHTSPTTAYRSAGRPEVMFVMERLIDVAARRFGFDRLELRRRNLVPPTARPYRNALGMGYDSGDYPAALDRALVLSEWAGFEGRRAEARRRGRYRGIGIGHSIELNSGLPRERAEITIDPAGRIEVVLGTVSAGQGHETSLAQMIAEWFGVGIDQVRLVTGDTDRVTVGGGSSSARSMRLGGIVMAKASDEIVSKGRQIAASLLEAAEFDVEFSAQRFRVRGTNRSIGLFEAAAAAVRGEVPEPLRGPLRGVADETMSTPSFAYGCAVCEAEVDPESGIVAIVRYTAVDDVGRAINPLLIHGQTHGGIAQGIGEALSEECYYDPETGQLCSMTFMDYAMPRADVLPSFTSEITEVPSTSNPLGLRGGSEGGICPALACIANAIVDALAELGVQHIELPATPERVWKAIEEAANGGRRTAGEGCP